MKETKMEMLDIVDEKGLPTGEVIDRKTAHEKGIRHRTAYLWIMRRGPKGAEVLLQKRSKNKDSNPGRYDISSAGHVPAGQEFIPSALRELEEELGITGVAPQDLIYCGQRTIRMQAVFHGKLFVDNQVSNVYCLIGDFSPAQLTLQESEVEDVRWINLEKCKDLVKGGDNSFPNCIYLEELEMLPDLSE